MWMDSRMRGSALVLLLLMDGCMDTDGHVVPNDGSDAAIEDHG